MEVPKIMRGNALHQMFDLQKKLLQHYITIEGLPNYPVDINSKSGQKVIKDFLRRFIEELSESFHSLSIAIDAVENNKPIEARLNIKDYNEEIADAIHFMLEIFIYSGIEVEEIENHIYGKFKERGWHNCFYVEGDPIASLLRSGAYQNQQGGYKISPREQYVIYPQSESLENPLVQGARLLSVKGMEKHAIFLWEITHTFNQAINHLNNREHHETEKKVNEIQYVEKLIFAFTVFIQYLEFAEFSEISLFASYYTKNQINHERLKNKY